METIGKVEAILNNSHILISSSEGLSQNSVVTIVSEIKDDSFGEKLGLDRILFPKGEVKILFHQGGEKYLASVFREEQEKTRIVKSPSPFAKQLMGVSSFLQGESKEITETVFGPPSAYLNVENSLNISFEKKVSVGDLVMR